jgi:superoxide dismutase, Cu-Zn family
VITLTDTHRNHERPDTRCLVSGLFFIVEAQIKMFILKSILIITLAALSAEQPNLDKLHEKAQAEMISRNASQVSGSVAFYQTKDGVEVKYNLQNLPAKKKLGFHIHEKPDCSSVDAKSAGGHYGKLHGGGGTSLDFPDRYAGDLPQISSDAKGKAEGSFIVRDLSLSETTAGKFTIKNRAIIVHEGPDDITKKSAKRISCGVIK